jgi:site-specific recombinase XerD
MTITQAVEQYVQHRTSLGMKFTSAAAILKRFSKACEPSAVEMIDSERVRAFLFAGGTETRNTEQKWSTLRGFYRFAVSRGMVDKSPLPTTIPRVTKHFVPYIYSKEEISRLLESAANLPVRTLQPHTVRMLVLTLYGTGLRCSEALRLRIQDVDLVAQLLCVNASKFYKDRLVPVGSEVTLALRNHLTIRRVLGHPEDAESPFLTTNEGGAISLHLADQAFRRLCRIAHVRREDHDRFQPRLHDLRHTFAVHRLIAWYQSGADLNRMLPRLSTYLGHVELKHTQHYLTMTPELLQQASRRFEQFAPEVAHD